MSARRTLCFSCKNNIPHEFQVVCPRKRRRSSYKAILGITRTLGKLCPAVSLVLVGMTQLVWTFSWPNGCVLCQDDVYLLVFGVKWVEVVNAHWRDCGGAPWLETPGAEGGRRVYICPSYRAVERKRTLFVCFSLSSEVTLVE